MYTCRHCNILLLLSCVGDWVCMWYCWACSILVHVSEALQDMGIGALILVMSSVGSCRDVCVCVNCTRGSHTVWYRSVDNVGIAWVTLNSPKRRNPLSSDVLERLHTAVDSIVASLNSADRVRAVVLASTGPVFSSGHDFREFVLDSDTEARESQLAEHARILSRCTELNRRLQTECPPTIAAVDGLATAAGCQLVCSCDLVFATRSVAPPTLATLYGMCPLPCRCVQCTAASAPCCHVMMPLFDVLSLWCNELV